MDDVEKVKQKIDIVDLINEFVPLKKTGRNFKTNCPFHNENSPSFVVSPERQIWHCFGCSKGGDIFTFICDYEKMDFSEALKFLADRAGIKLSSTVFKSENERRKNLIYTLNSLAANFYNYLLTSHNVGKKGLSYLVEKRKLNDALIKTFNLGYAPRASSLSTYLTRKKGYREQDLIDAGLSISRGRDLIDFFRDRIIFPIKDVRGNIIAFSGRALSSEQMPKYVNTKETLVYRKGDTVYGIDLAKEGIKKEGKVIIVEGEFDVISAFKEGLTNFVAVKGTALTENQIKLLKRYAPKITFCFDTDLAGEEAQRRSIQMIEREGITSSVIIPPSGKDPDELLNEDPILFKKAVKQDINIYDFIINSAVASSDKNTAEGKRKILEKTLPYLAAIENEVIKEHYMKKLGSEIDTSTEAVLRQADKIKAPPSPLTKQEIKKQKTREELVEEYLLSLILQAKDVKETTLIVDVILSVPLSVPAINRLFKQLVDYVKTNNSFDPNAFIKFLPKELIPTYDKCILSPIPSLEDEKLYAFEVEKVARDAKTISIKIKLQRLSDEIKSKEKDRNEEALSTLRQEFDALTSQLN